MLHYFTVRRRTFAKRVLEFAAIWLVVTASTTAMVTASQLASTVVASVPEYQGMRDLGSSALQPVHLAVVLNYRNQSELDLLVAQPVGGRTLSSDEFRAYFAPTAKTYATTIGVLRRAGFSISNTFPNRTIVDVTASGAVVDRYFHTDIHRVAIDGMGVRYANAKPAYLPAELRGVVRSITGFNDISWAHPQSVAMPENPARYTDPFKVGPPLNGPSGGYGPLAFAWGYRLPVQYGHNGNGHAAAIVIMADPSDSDLATFLKEYNIKRTGATSRTPIDGGPGSGGGFHVEAALDYETIAGLAPGANIDLFEPPNTASGIVDAYNAVASQNLDASINSSFGQCETADTSFDDSVAAIFEQGLAQGQTFHTSTGDTGQYSCKSSSPSVSAPADTPYGVAIGGTVLTVDSKGFWHGEQYWNDSKGDAGGGGVSVVFARPSWQTNNGVKYGGRSTPDISFNAGSPGEAIYFSGSWSNWGGTSLASPIFGACVVDLVSQYSARPANLDQKLYGAWHKLGYKSSKTVYAHDVATGTPDGILVPKKGYDLATGIGSFECEPGGAAYLFP